MPGTDKGAGFVRTVLGDIRPEELGNTSCHDHLVVRRVNGTNLPQKLVLDEYEKTQEELRAFVSQGGRTVVDAQPFGAGRDVEALRRLCKRTGVHIIASTGFHTRFFYPREFWAYDASVEEIAALFISEIEEGAYRFDPADPFASRSGIRAGIIKVANISVKRKFLAGKLIRAKA